VNQTPAHEQHNPDLLQLIPLTSKHLIEIGCSTGALAREYKKINPECSYSGVDISPHYVELAKRHCDEVLALDIEDAKDDFFSANRTKDCWIFGDSLEHLRNPWEILKSIRKIIPANGSVVACIPNAQHWSVQARLCAGDFRYTDSGLLDKTHLRWFTRQTIVEMFNASGYKIVSGISRTFDEPAGAKFLPLIREMAKIAGVDPDIALSDALPLQYVVCAMPN
jgi:ubiquinone/menaquinone biosynthesis C-methylase UbiE